MTSQAAVCASGNAEQEPQEHVRRLSEAQDFERNGEDQDGAEVGSKNQRIPHLGFPR